MLTRLSRALSSLSIKGKTLLLVGVLAAFSTGGLLVVQFQIASSRTAITEQMSYLDILDRTNRVHQAFSDMKYWFADLANSLSSEAEENASTSLATFREGVQTLDALKGDDRDTLIANAMQIEKLSLDALMEYMTEERAAGDALMAQARTLISENDQIIRDVLESSRAFAAEAALKVDADSRLASVLSLVTLAVVLSCAGLILVTTLKAIVTPIRNITTAMMALAQGNNDDDIPYRNNPGELGDMARTVMIFKENAIKIEQMNTEREAQREAREAERRRAEAERRAAEERQQAELAQQAEQQRQMAEAVIDLLQGRVFSSLDQVVASAHELEDASTTMNNAVTTSQNTASDVSNSSETASSHAQSVASAAAQMAASVQEIASQIAAATRVTSEAVAQQGRVKQTAMRMVDLVAEVTRVVGLIDEIADMTNLLALNATIEAARAGEAGRGFSVVAAEVRTLAGETQKATESISRQIDEIHSASRETASAVDEIGSSIGRIDEVSTAVAAAIEEQQASTDEISRSIAEAADSTSGISEMIVSVVREIQQSGSSASHVSELSQALISIASGLRGEVESYLNTLNNNKNAA
ncbi:hypothetical protein GCM10007972_20980 [Iodidimonas muriae]|uniref:Methyl-accepting chemotaxis protein n=1 Tax=Iodidimonas muriae TaxID=261467 RepID=A0ABQ2LET9_9PROT|nr:methyl-accepting chemotaxis protein [Iodidimonas muriae]GER07520.1 hypothetical protein JCM17843_18300 [Kordiimonadales bacterium JCM 17843]GGO14151.1 hypothetical protein GCM10007972_20980 [Iodidimonas muriae]